MASINDEVFRLKLAGDEVPIASAYEVTAGVIDIPAAFSMTVGHAGLAVELVNKYPEFTPFELYVGDVAVQRGEIDTIETFGDKGTQLNISGRDILKYLVDNRIESERTFEEKTYLQLTEVALKEVGLEGAIVALDNVANRMAITGKTTVQETVAPTTENSEQLQTEFGALSGQQSTTTRTVYNTIKAEIGTSWWEFLAEQYRRAGLFLWQHVPSNGFVLSRPDGTQAPSARILNRRGKENQPGEVTIIGNPHFRRSSLNRYSQITVVNRTGGGKRARKRVSATVYDQEMIEILNPNPEDRADGGKRKKAWTIRDDKARTIEQAEFLARRKIAESRRNGWSLRYTVAGHTAPAYEGGSSVIWQPDTVVWVHDDALGLEGPMYVEGVTYRRNPQTTTELRLMRIEDLLFAEDPEPSLAPRKGVHKVRQGVTEKLIWEINPQWGNLPTAAWQQADGSVKPATGDDFRDGYATVR